MTELEKQKQQDLELLIDSTLVDFAEVIGFYEDLIIQAEAEDNYEEAKYYNDNLNNITQVTIQKFELVYRDIEGVNIREDLMTLKDKIKNYVRKNK